MKKILITALIALSVGLTAQDNITITNRTDSPLAGQIAEIIAREVMTFDTLNVTIYTFPSNTNPKLEGVLDKSKVDPHTYTIMINPIMSDKRLIVMMCHEFVHIKQYEHEGLETFGDIWVWNPDNKKEKQGITWGSMDYTEYANREFENDAFRRQWDVKKDVMKIMKGKGVLAKRKR